MQYYYEEGEYREVMRTFELIPKVTSERKTERWRENESVCLRENKRKIEESVCVSERMRECV